MIILYTFFLFIGIFLSLAAVITAFFLPNKYIWIAILSAVLGGLCQGIYFNGLPHGLISGLILGILFLFLLIPIALFTKNGRKRGQEILRKYPKN
jgi:hypothetical protein